MAESIMSQSKPELVEQPEARISAARLKPYFDALAPVGEATVEVGVDGLWTQAVDPANILQVEVELDDVAFESYEAGDGFSFGYHAPKIQSYLERIIEADERASVNLTFDRDATRFTGRYGSFRWEAAWIDPDSIRAAADVSLDLPARFSLHSSDFKDAIEWADWVRDDERLYLGFDPDDGFTVTLERDTQVGEYNLSAGEFCQPESEPDEPKQSIYTFEYIQDIAESLIEGPIWIELGTEYPVIVTQPFADGHGEARYYVAPQIRA